jgi:hypothetical protein
MGYVSNFETASDIGQETIVYLVTDVVYLVQKEVGALTMFRRCGFVKGIAFAHGMEIF